MKTEEKLSVEIRSLKKHDLDFKKECIKKYMDGQSIASISRETGVSEGILHKWKKKLIGTEDGELDIEKLDLRKRILELELEKEVLKKAAIIFGRDP